MTKMKILVLFLCTIPTIMMAQRWNVEKKNSIDIITGIEMSSMRLKPRSEQFADKNKTQLNRPQSSINPTYTLGLDYNSALSSKFFAKTGARFFQTHYTTDNENLIEEKNLKKLNRLAAKENIQTFDYELNYLQIPLMGRWVYSGNRCKSFLEFGVLGNVYMNSKIRDASEESNPLAFIKTKEDISPLHLYGVLSIGGEFWITKNIPAFIQLTGRGQLSKLINNGIKEETLGMGIQSGLRYAF